MPGTRTQSAGPVSTEPDGIAWGRTGFERLEPLEERDTGTPRGFAEPFRKGDGLSRFEPQKRRDAHRFNRSCALAARDPAESSADFAQSPTHKRFPSSSSFGEPYHIVPWASNLLHPGSNPLEERPPSISQQFERPESAFAESARNPSGADAIPGGPAEEAFPGEIDVPLLEAERLQEENHPGAILSLLGGELQILIDAFAIWRDADQAYFTARAIGYDPPSHRHRVEFFADGGREWVALWREDVKILVEGEDFDGLDNIPDCMDRDGRSGPRKRRRTAKSGEGNPGVRCGAEAPEAHVAAPESDDDSETDDMDDVSTASAAAGGASFDERWRNGVRDGPQKCYFLFENVAAAHRGQGAVGPDGELEGREKAWDFMQRH